MASLTIALGFVSQKVTTFVAIVDMLSPDAIGSELSVAPDFIAPPLSGDVDPDDPDEAVSLVPDEGLAVPEAPVEPDVAGPPLPSDVGFVSDSMEACMVCSAHSCPLESIAEKSSQVIMDEASDPDGMPPDPVDEPEVVCAEVGVANRAVVSASDTTNCFIRILPGMDGNTGVKSGDDQPSRWSPQVRRQGG